MTKQPLCISIGSQRGGKVPPIGMNWTMRFPALLNLQGLVKLLRQSVIKLAIVGKYDRLLHFMDRYKSCFFLLPPSGEKVPTIVIMTQGEEFGFCQRDR